MTTTTDFGCQRPVNVTLAGLLLSKAFEKEEGDDDSDAKETLTLEGDEGTDNGQCAVPEEDERVPQEEALTHEEDDAEEVPMAVPDKRERAPGGEDNDVTFGNEPEPCVNADALIRGLATRDKFC